MSERSRLPRRSKNDAPQVQPCPICGKLFDIKDIERHADRCAAQVDGIPPESSGTVLGNVSEFILDRAVVVIETTPIRPTAARPRPRPPEETDVTKKAPDRI